MPRTRILRTIIEKIEPRNLKKLAREEKAKQKQLENQERQRLEAEQRKAEKEAQRIAERKRLLEERIQEALEKGEITAEEAAWLPELDTDRVVTWAHVPYMDHLTRLRTQMDNGEWSEVCLYLSDKKDYNPIFTEYVRTLFNETYSFEEYRPHESPFRRWKKRNKHKDTTDSIDDKETIQEQPIEDISVNIQAESSTTDNTRSKAYEPWADNLYDACAPHLVVTHNSSDGQHKFGIMTIWRSRFTKHGLSMMARSQFIKSKLFEQEIDIPVFMIIGIGGTAQMPQQLFVVPFSDIENHFIPKPIAYRYEIDPNTKLHFIPELQKLR